MSGHGKSFAFVLLLFGVLAGGCHSSHHSSSCMGGVDPSGRACTKTSECAVTCVCERGSSKFKVNTGQCRTDNKCSSADFDCTAACLIVLASWTGDFCTGPTPTSGPGTPVPTSTPQPAAATPTETPAPTATPTSAG